MHAAVQTQWEPHSLKRMAEDGPTTEPPWIPMSVKHTDGRKTPETQSEPQFPMKTHRTSFPRKEKTDAVQEYCPATLVFQEQKQMTQESSKEGPKRRRRVEQMANQPTPHAPNRDAPLKRDTTEEKQTRIEERHP